MRLMLVKLGLIMSGAFICVDEDGDDEVVCVNKDGDDTLVCVGVW